MERDYYIYTVIEPADGGDGGNAELHYLGAAQGHTPQQAARAWFVGTRDEQPRSAPPKRVAVIPARHVHFLEPRVQTSTQLKFA